MAARYQERTEINASDLRDMDDMNDNKKTLSPAAERALAEAKARRAARDAEAAAKAPAPKEKGGQNGPDPARYGDWEKGGIVSDF